MSKLLELRVKGFRGDKPLKEYREMTDAEIGLVPLKRWKKLIKDFNYVLYALHNAIEDAKEAKKAYEQEVAELSEKLEVAENLLSTYDKPVQELIVEHHNVIQKAGMWSPFCGQEMYSGVVDVVLNAIKTERIVARDWGAEHVDENNIAYNDMTGFNTLSSDGLTFFRESVGAKFWYIDANGVRNVMAEGEIVSVKSRDGKILFELSDEDRELTVIDDGQVQ